jgi:hypothetical protein
VAVVVGLLPPLRVDVALTGVVDVVRRRVEVLPRRVEDARRVEVARRVDVALTTEVALITDVDVMIWVDGRTEVKVRILVDARAVRVSVTRMVLVTTTVAWTVRVAEMIFVDTAISVETGSGVSASSSPHSPRPTWHPSPQWSVVDPQYPWREQHRPNRDPEQVTLSPQVPSVLALSEPEGTLAGTVGGPVAVPDMQYTAPLTNVAQLVTEGLDRRKSVTEMSASSARDAHVSPDRAVIVSAQEFVP